jgi:hypothetical protein
MIAADHTGADGLVEAYLMVYMKLRSLGRSVHAVRVLELSAARQWPLQCGALSSSTDGRR